MRVLLLILVSALLLGCSTLHAQVTPLQGSNLRQKLIPVSSAPYQLDSVSIVPGSLRINGYADSIVLVDAVNAVIRFKTMIPVDSVFVIYRVFPLRFNAGVQRRSFDTVMDKFIGQPYVPDFGQQAADRFFDFGNITYNGSFGRGISFGNSQDAVVSSNLNLQLSGFLADSIELVAAITDNNIPIQPDGTTQQLNEFDRIFLQFKKRSWALSLGDIDIRQQPSYFVSFYKRLQGILFETNQQVSKSVSNRTLLSGSIAKGKFTRNVFQGQEGNQGPYRLTGANNEFFFVVLANTERVYIDGELMQRGDDQDYIINYNTAEIAFTPRRMITKDSRIQVEFEYSDRNYLNANLYAFNETSINNKLKIRLSAFHNSDAKNSSINQVLDPSQKMFLDSLGNNYQQAFYPHAVMEDFEPGKILYKKIDTLFDSSRDSIFVYSSHPDSARYNLSFVDVGQGFGDYLPDLNGANGKVFRWVAPISGMRQGRYQPAIFLVTPKKQQVVSVGADYNITENTNVNAELAMSNYDVNTFSSKGNADNKGYATRIALRNRSVLGKHSLISELHFENVASKFRPVERLRSVEFYRDWGLPLVVGQEQEQLVIASLQLTNNKENNLRYQFYNFQRGAGFSGIRNVVTHQQNLKGWRFNNVLQLTNMSGDKDHGYFFRPTLSVIKSFKVLKDHALFANYSVEHNEIKDRRTDSIALQSFSFSILQAGIRSPENNANKWSLIYYTRTDAYPYAYKLVKSDRSQNIQLTAELMKSEKRQLRFNATYRNLTALSTNVSNIQSDKSLLGRTEYQFNEWKGLVIGNILYEVGAGQEQKRDYAFLEVPAGQGEFTWNDYDNNGLQSLNEFEIALFPDQAKYIRIFTPTNDFIKANYNTLNYSVSVNPKNVIRQQGAGSIGKFISRINLQSSLQINKKEVASALVSFNPFSNPLSDSSLLTLNEILVNTFSYNRFSTKWGLDINNARNSARALLTYGYETRKLNEWTAKIRLNVSREILLDLTGKKGANILSSSNIKFNNRNYNIDQHSLEPRITFTKGSNFRVITGYRFGTRKNTIGELEKAVSNAINLETKYNILQSTSVLAKFTYQDIAFTSNNSTPNTNSTTSYMLLEGLLPGKNFLWTLDLTKRLSSSLEMNIQYEGRRAGESRTVHVGRASIRAIL